MPTLQSDLQNLATSTSRPTATAELTVVSDEQATGSPTSTSQPLLTPMQTGTQPSRIAQIESPTRTPFTTATSTVISDPYEAPVPLPTSLTYPTRQPTRMPKPTATIDASSFAQRTGQPEIDLIIEVIQARDKEALRALISFTTFKCTNVMGIGGPPKCWEVWGKKFDPPLPEGTELELLPIGAPVWWPLPETVDSRLDDILNANVLKAVYEAETDTYLSSEEGWPESDTAIVLSRENELFALLIKDGRIVIIDYPGPWEDWYHEIGDYLIQPSP